MFGSTISGVNREVQACVGMRTLSDAHNVDLVKALPGTGSIPVLCTELCSLHDRIHSLPFLDQAASVGLLHYAAAMIASQHKVLPWAKLHLQPH